MKRKEIEEELKKAHMDETMETREMVQKCSRSIAMLSKDLSWIKWILNIIIGILIALVCLLAAL